MHKDTICIETAGSPSTNDERGVTLRCYNHSDSTLLLKEGQKGQLKIYHMRIEANREDSPEEQRNRCAEKLAVLLEQEKDLTSAIDMLLADMEAGKKYMKVYKQMKMYNDPSLNPVLYAQNGSNK